MNKETNFEGIAQIEGVLVVVLRLYCFLFEQCIRIWSDSLVIIHFSDSVIK